jgi:hypothetical protein
MILRQPNPFQKTTDHHEVTGDVAMTACQKQGKEDLKGKGSG